MLKGIAAAASGMLPQLKRQEVITNNLANAATAGYKRDRLFVQELDLARAGSVPTEADWHAPYRLGVAVDFSDTVAIVISLFSPWNEPFHGIRE